jgi:hypothetical protein
MCLLKFRLLPALGRPRSEESRFQASLAYTVRPRLKTQANQFRLGGMWVILLEWLSRGRGSLKFSIIL